MPAAATKAVEALRIWRVRAEDPVVVEHDDPISAHTGDASGVKKPAESITGWLKSVKKAKHVLSVRSIENPCLQSGTKQLLSHIFKNVYSTT
jgi:hypothetical protein